MMDFLLRVLIGLVVTGITPELILIPLMTGACIVCLYNVGTSVLELWRD